MVIDKRERVCRIYSDAHSRSPVDVVIDPMLWPPVKIVIPQAIVGLDEAKTIITILQRAIVEGEEMVNRLDPQ